MKILQLLSADHLVAWRIVNGQLLRHRVRCDALTDEGELVTLAIVDGAIEPVTDCYLRHTSEGPPPPEWCRPRGVDPEQETLRRVTSQLVKDAAAVLKRLQAIGAPVSRTKLAEHMPGWGKPRGHAAVTYALETGVIIEREIMRQEGPKLRARVCLFPAGDPEPDSPATPPDVASATPLDTDPGNKT